jgi:hypothetical protein
MSLQIDLFHKLTKAFASLELYNNYDSDYWEHERWLDPKVITNISNIIQIDLSFLCMHKKPRSGEWNPRDVQF